ncbi:MAG: hypothetical protein M1838_001392 [Thelocarpon superellum]|nr:MAG: hypothetical protein M1838_001392 [Thelocarpon superellum]
MATVHPKATPPDPFEDLSGVSTRDFDNPYDALLSTSLNATEVQRRYAIHRQTRNGQQRAKLLDPAFPGVTLDPVLLRLHDAAIEPGYVDPRHCLVFWARPPAKLRALIHEIQQKLLSVAPNLWLMPLNHLHMTTLEVTHSRTAAEIAALIKTMEPHIPQITDYTQAHRARLIKPMLSYDAAAVALSFEPAAGEGLARGRTAADDEFTYHHLRRDLFTQCQQAGVKIDSRYTVPSAHLTIGRFVTADDHSRRDDGSNQHIPDREKMQQWIAAIENINRWLQEQYWPHAQEMNHGAEWIVGEEKGLDCRHGTLWYGDGTTFRLGGGF